jgi:hypothetical protein
VSDPPSHDETPTDPHLRLPEARASEERPPAKPPGAPAPPPRSEVPRVGTQIGAPPSRPIPPPGARPGAFPARPIPPPLEKRPSTLPPPTFGPPAGVASGAPGGARPSSPPPGAAPDFMMPRPPAHAPAPARAADANDPWRERIAALEVQLSATRAAATRASTDVAAMREKLESTAARVDAIDQRKTPIAPEPKVIEPAERTEPALPSNLEGKLGELETMAQAARAAAQTVKQELAENKRLDEARQARIESIEDRLSHLGKGSGEKELRLAIDRAEVRVVAAEKEQSAIRDRMGEIEKQLKESGAKLTKTLEKTEKLMARLEELEEAQDALREASKVDVLLPRIADLEALVLETGRADAKLQKQLDELRAAAGAPKPAKAPAKKRAPKKPAAE